MDNTTPSLQWSLKTFYELTLDELYAILKLRTDVFSVEQHAVYQDLDGKDQGSFHLSAFEGERLIAYCRLLPPGLAFPEASIGRVVSALSHRGTGTGKMLMERAMSLCRDHFGNGPIQIGAQYYLVGFYSGFGFRAFGEIYMEDGIQHIHMIYTPGNVSQ
jgi:ElaA protein